MDTDKFIRIDNSQKYALAKATIPEAARLNENGIKQALETNPHYAAPATPQIFVQQSSLHLTFCAENTNILKRLDDRAVDVLDYIVSRIIIRKPQPDGEITINIDQMLETFGLKKNTYAKGKTSGYSIEQRRQHYCYIKDLSDLWIATEETTVKGKTETVEQHLFMLKQRVTTGNLNVKEVTIQVNSFFDKLLLYRQNTIMLPIKLLGLDPYRRSIEKRIGKYFYRFTKKESNHYIHSIIKNCNIPIDMRRKAAFRKRFEQAINKLVEEGIIADYKYLDKTTNFECWMDARIQVSLP